jgi:hypothetical protein
MTDADRPGSGEDPIEKTEKAQESAPEGRPFDIRQVIGGLFVFYGVVVLIAGIVDGAEAKEQAAGIDINLWAGAAMLLLGAFFLVWMRLNPLRAAGATPGEQAAERP